jgi:hypothetical protein
MPGGPFENWFRSEASNGHTGKCERDQRNNLNDMMRRGAKGTIVIGLSGWMAVDDLNDAAHQHQRNANNPQERHQGESRTLL